MRQLVQWASWKAAFDNALKKGHLNIVVDLQADLQPTQKQEILMMEATNLDLHSRPFLSSWNASGHCCNDSEDA